MERFSLFGSFLPPCNGCIAHSGKWQQRGMQQATHTHAYTTTEPSRPTDRVLYNNTRLARASYTITGPLPPQRVYRVICTCMVSHWRRDDGKQSTSGTIHVRALSNVKGPSVSAVAWYARVCGLLELCYGQAMYCVIIVLGNKKVSASSFYSFDFFFASVQRLAVEHLPKFHFASAAAGVQSRVYIFDCFRIWKKRKMDIYSALCVCANGVYTITNRSLVYTLLDHVHEITCR